MWICVVPGQFLSAKMCKKPIRFKVNLFAENLTEF